MKLLNHDDIWSVYSLRAAIDDVAQAFVAVSEQATNNPLRTRIVLDDRRTMLIMPCYSSKVEAAAVKTIGLYPDNAKKGLATAPASIVLMDAENGQVSAILDGDTVTKIRTGASSGVAFQYLANPNPQVGLVVGAGGQAFTQVLAMIEAAPSLVELRIANPFAGLAEEFIAQLLTSPQFQNTNFQGTLTSCTDSDQAAIDADLITLVTSSTKPVLSAVNLKPGVTISCVGAYQPHMQECGADIMQQAAHIFCDDVDSALEESGDLIIPLEAGLISSDKIRGSIGQVISGKLPGRLSPAEIIVYETVGVGAQDLWAALSIFKLASQKGIGQDWQ